jgi:hypothetical protein
MQPIDLTDPAGPVRLAGIDHLARGRNRGLTNRLPEWALAQVVEPAVPLISSMPSGGRLEFTTDATGIELDVLVTRIHYLTRPLTPAVFELVIDGAVVARTDVNAGNVFRFERPLATDFEFVRGERETLAFTELPAGTKQVELWLPHDATVQLGELRIDSDAAIERTPPGGRRWVHYGSSISHCMEAERPTGVWPAVAARRAGVDLYSLGIAGQCQLDQFAARTIRDLDADLISLKLGINVVNADTMRERTFVPAVHGLLDTIRDRHTDVPIIVISPIICPVVEDHPGPTLPDDETGTITVADRPEALMTGALSLGRIRDLLEAVVASRGDPHLHYLHGHRLFGPDDLDDLPDGLHPNAAGYARMGERFWAIAFDGGPFTA